MRQKISLLLALLSLLTPELRAADAPAQAPVRAAGDPQATLRTGDVFEMRLTGMPVQLVSDIANLQYTIGTEGTVNIPLIGKIKAVGLSATQLADVIEARYISDKIFTKPTVIINPIQGQRFVSVSGGVRAPQRLQWTADMTLSSAVGNCQGLSDFGSPKGVKLVRETKIVGVFNLKDLEKDPSKDPKLLPGDQVVVPGA